MIADNGTVVDLVDGVASIVGQVPCGYVYVDGSTVGDVTESSLKDRRILGDEGFIAITVVVDSVTGKLSAPPSIHARGFAEDDSVFDGVLPRVEEALERAITGGNRDAVPAAADRPTDDRSLGERGVPPPADDHPGGGRGLIGFRWLRCERSEPRNLRAEGGLWLRSAVGVRAAAGKSGGLRGGGLWLTRRLGAGLSTSLLPQVTGGTAVASRSSPSEVSGADPWVRRLGTAQLT